MTLITGLGAESSACLSNSQSMKYCREGRGFFLFLPSDGVKWELGCSLIGGMTNKEPSNSLSVVSKPDKVDVPRSSERRVEAQMDLSPCAACVILVVLFIDYIGFYQELPAGPILDLVVRF